MVITMSAGFAVQRLVGHARVARRQLVRIVAALAGILALLRIADHRPCRIVELQVAAAGVIKSADRLLVGHRHIVEIGIEIRIDSLLIDCRPWRK